MNVVLEYVFHAWFREHVSCFTKNFSPSVKYNFFCEVILLSRDIVKSIT